VGHAPKVGHCSSVCEWDRDFQRCYRCGFLNNLVLAVPKVGHMSKTGTFPKCKVAFFYLFIYSILSQKNLVIVKFLSVSEMGQIS